MTRLSKTPVLGLLALIPGSAMVFLDHTILPVAIPAIQREFNATDVAMQWSVNSYLLALALLILLGGKIVDAWGGRQVFIGAVGGFVVFSAACGLSPSAIWLVVARFLQGASAALLIPASGALMRNLFPPHRRGRAIGLSVSVSSLFSMLGPLLGGYLTQALSWRWVFWVNLPLGLLCMGCAAWLFPKEQKHRITLDGWGSLWFFLATCGFVVGLMQLPSWSWSSWKTYLSFGIGAVSLALLLIQERRAKHPFLELPLLRYPVFRASLIGITASGSLLMLGVFWAVFFQQTLGYSPVEAGLLSFLSALPVLFMSPIGGAISDRFGPKIPVSLGFLCMTIGLLFIAAFCDQSRILLALGLFIFGAGVPLIMTPSYSAGLTDVPARKAGMASGLIGTLRNLGATFAVAIFGAILAELNAWMFVPAAVTEAKGTLNVQQAQGLVLGADGKLWDQLSPKLSADLAEMLRQAEVSSLAWLHVGLAGLLLVTWLVVLAVFRRPRIPPHEHGFADGWD